MEVGAPVRMVGISTPLVLVFDVVGDFDALAERGAVTVRVAAPVKVSVTIEGHAVTTLDGCVTESLLWSLKNMENDVEADMELGLSMAVMFISTFETEGSIADDVRLRESDNGAVVFCWKDVAASVIVAVALAS